MTNADEILKAFGDLINTTFRDAQENRRKNTFNKRELETEAMTKEELEEEGFTAIRVKVSLPTNKESEF